jgi:hypothetical protein
MRRSALRHPGILPEVTDSDFQGDQEPPYCRLDVGAAACVVAFRGPMGWLSNRLPAVVAWLINEVPVRWILPWRGPEEVRR